MLWFIFRNDIALNEDGHLYMLIPVAHPELEDHVSKFIGSEGLTGGINDVHLSLVVQVNDTFQTAKRIALTLTQKKNLHIVQMPIMETL